MGHCTWSVLALLIFLGACKNSRSVTEKETYQGQGPIPLVATTNLPVQRQWKGTWVFQDSTVYFDNRFDGARLNGVAHEGKDRFTLLFTAENTPINPSPWYAFKVWSKSPREVILKLVFQNSRCRYYPKISNDGRHFKLLDSTRFTPINPGVGQFGLEAVPEMAEIKIAIDKDPIWITAQELYPSGRVAQWVDSLSQETFISGYTIGRSMEDRSIDLLELNEGASKKSILVISRQHPPEVTGFLAMKSFMETLAGNSDLAQRFRKQFTVFNIPLMNPDGVDHGHWRHNVGGVDLNRDWHSFNQPETKAVREFLDDRKKEGHTFVFGVDFHSTWDDIYYPLDSTVTGKRGKIVYDWIKNISKRLPSKVTNISASDKLHPTMVSRNHFFVAHGMPSIVFELGDNTPRPFLREKGKVAAEELMHLLLEGNK